MRVIKKIVDTLLFANKVTKYFNLDFSFAKQELIWSFKYSKYTNIVKKICLKKHQTFAHANRLSKRKQNDIKNTNKVLM